MNDQGLFKIVKRDFKHFKTMAKCFEGNRKGKIDFWEYIKAYSDVEISKIQQEDEYDSSIEGIITRHNLKGYYLDDLACISSFLRIKDQETRIGKLVEKAQGKIIVDKICQDGINRKVIYCKNKPDDSLLCGIKWVEYK